MSRSQARKGDTKPTTTTLVAEALSRADDFMAIKQLCLAAWRTPNQVSAALCHLRGHGAVDSAESGGRLWWMGTPGGDDRTVVYARITAEQIIKTRRKAVTRRAT